MNIKLDIFGINNAPSNFYGAPALDSSERKCDKKENDTVNRMHYSYNYD